MATARELAVIRSDLRCAKDILYPTDTAKFETTTAYDINLAAYFSVQAIEKCIKSLIRKEELARGINPDAEDIWHHNLNELMLRLNRYDGNFLPNHPFVADNGTILTKFNGLRYGDRAVGKSDVYVLYKEAKDFFHELEREYLRENGRNKNIMFENAVESYGELSRYSLNTTRSKYNKTREKSSVDVSER